MRLLSRKFTRFPYMCDPQDLVLPEYRIYGWRPSRPDHRDHQADPSGIKLQPEVDPREQMAAPYDQGQLGSCTANAVAAAVQYDWELDKQEVVETPSRLDIYWGERSYEGTTSYDSGAFGRDGFKYAANVGLIPEHLWPYDITKFNVQPPADTAVRQRLTRPYRVVPRNKTAWKRVLSNRQTIAFGFTVYESFESQQVAQTGIMSHPSTSERVLGGHEVLAVGYLKAYPDYVLVRNSWGTGWGLGGYFLMPWSVVLDRNLSSDFRTIYRPAGQ